MKEAIAVINQRDEFSLEVWENASTEERKKILQRYMDEIVGTYGIGVKTEINF